MYATQLDRGDTWFMTTSNKGNGGTGAPMGRPRDGSIRRRVIDAAIECYAERGWSGFSFEAVSTRSMVGRPALYRRWADREELLVDAFRESSNTLSAPDHGNVRDDLTDLAMTYRQLMTGARGRAGIRLFIERENLAAVFETVSAETSAQRDLLIMGALKRGQSRGEIRTEADLNVASQLLVGALMLDALGYKASRSIRNTVAATIDILVSGLGPSR
jgi:AcrR family transcriptional regulator